MPPIRRTAALAGILSAALILPAFAANDFENAIQAGATPLDSQAIAEVFVGNTVTAKAGQKTFHFYYSSGNALSGKLVGGNWSGKGFYGITDGNRICVSMETDKGRLRCMAVVKHDDTVKKFDVNGKLTFEVIAVRSGNLL